MRYLLNLAIGIALAVAISGCATSREWHPPTIALRDIANMERIASGETIDLGDRTWLFLPTGYTVPLDGRVFLTIHFHTATWFAAEEHIRRGSSNPLLAFAGRTGSSQYRIPFEDRTLFARLLDQVVERLAHPVGASEPSVTGVEISSFSAGYGAVREIIKTPEYVDLIESILLMDSMYAGYDDPESVERRPEPQHVDSFIDFAKLAVRGKKTFLISYSSIVPGTYASTEECARAVVEAVGGTMTPVAPGSHPSALPSLDFPLIARYDRGGLHVWGYAGDDANAHMTHARALADFWKALE